jgi:hypothetical protein
MSKKTSRSSDLGTTLIAGTTGFVVRKRNGVGKVVHFFLLAAMVVFGAALLVYYRSPEGSALAVVIGGCFALVAVNLEKLKRNKNYLEFMNALFSSALGKGYKFCCIVKANGEVVFFNRPFQAVFPAFLAQESRSLETLLTLYNVPQDQREMLKSLIGSNSEGSFATTIREESATSSLSLTFHVEPIERPTGFVLLRGK